MTDINKHSSLLWHGSNHSAGQCKYLMTIKVTDFNKHSSLLRHIINHNAGQCKVFNDNH
jgi:hypothetical protein